MSEKTKKADEEEISPNEYFKIRSRAVEELKSTPGSHPYPHKVGTGVKVGIAGKEAVEEQSPPSST